MAAGIRKPVLDKDPPDASAFMDSHQEYGYQHSHASHSYLLAVGGNTPFRRRYIAASA